jgi:hypothetical protein
VGYHQLSRGRSTYTTRPAGYPSGGVPPAVERPLHLLGFSHSRQVVFPVPTTADLPAGTAYAHSCVAAMAAAHGAMARLPPTMMLSAPDTRLCLLAALLFPLREVTVPTKKKRVRSTSRLQSSCTG